MALRFKSEFRNLAKDLYKIEIHDSSFSGTESEFVLRNQGFKLSYSGGENTWDLIKPSTLSFTINVDNNTLKTFISDLTSSDETRFTVKVFLDETKSPQQTPPNTPDGTQYELYWLGYIEKRLITIDDASYPYDLNLVCLDGIERLKTLDYKASATSPYEDLVTINTHISRILGKIDVGNHFAATDDMFATRINWYATNSIHSTSAGVFANTKLHSSAFNTFNTENEVVFKSFYDVLNIICQLFQCRFMLNKGRFYFTHFFKLEENTSITYNSYRKNGNVSTVANYVVPTNSIVGEIGFSSVSNPNESLRKAGFFQRTKTFGGKLSSVKIRFNGSGDSGQTDDFTGDLYPLNYFPAWEYENSNWIPYGQSLEGPNLLGFFEATQQVKFRIHYNFTIRVTKDDSVVNPGSFYGRVVIPFWLKAPVSSGSSANNAFWETETITAVNSTDPIPSPWVGASWVTSNQNTSLNNAQVFKTPVIYIQSTATDVEPKEYLFDTMVQTSDCPVTEASGVHLYNDYSGDWGSAYTNNNLSGSDNNWFAVESPDGNTIYPATYFSGYNVELVYQNIELYAYQDNEPFAGSVIDSYVDSNEQNDTNSEQLVIDNITFNDGPNAIPEKVIWINNGSNYIQSTTWKLNGAGNPFKIHKLITDLILKFNYLPREVLNSTILLPFTTGDIPINPTSSFPRFFTDENGDAILNEVYCFNRLEFDANLNQYSFSGTKTAPVTEPTIVTEDNPTNPDPGGGYEGDGFVDNGGNDTVIDLIINDAIGNINEYILPSGTVKTNIDVTGSDGTGGIDVDIADNTEILLMASDPTRRIKKLKINGNVNKGDTTITVDGFTPEYLYETGAKIIVSRVSLMGSGGGGGTPGGSDTQVQFNDNGSFGGDSGLTYNKTTDTLTTTNLVAQDVDITGVSNALTVNCDDGNVGIYVISTDGISTIRFEDIATNDVIIAGADGDDFFIRTDDGGFKIKTQENAVTALELTSDGNLKTHNIGNIFDTEAYLTPVDFCMTNHGSHPGFSSSNGGSSEVSNGSLSQYATFQTPLGYRATRVQVYGQSSSSTFDVYACSVANAGATALTSSPSVNTNQALSTAHIGQVGKYISIKYTPGAIKRELYGAKITLERT